MASCTRLRVCSEMGRLPVITYETVLWETPAMRATSRLVNTTATSRHRCGSTRFRDRKHTPAIQHKGQPPTVPAKWRGGAGGRALDSPAMTDTEQDRPEPPL